MALAAAAAAAPDWISESGIVVPEVICAKWPYVQGPAVGLMDFAKVAGSASESQPTPMPLIVKQPAGRPVGEEEPPVLDDCGLLDWMDAGLVLIPPEVEAALPTPAEAWRLFTSRTLVAGVVMG